MINELFFNTLVYTSYILIFVSYFGLIKNAPDVLNELNNFISLYTSIFLIYAFNPIRINDIQKVTKFDLKIAYHAGLIIILTSLSSYISQIEIKGREEVMNIYKGIILN